jgi:hypothetical protein
MAIGRGTAMNRQRANRTGSDRRGDPVTADLVEVGLLFIRVFGRHKGRNFFRCTIVEPYVYQRVLLGPSRLPPARGAAGDLVPAE